MTVGSATQKIYMDHDIWLLLDVENLVLPNLVPNSAQGLEMPFFGSPFGKESFEWNCYNLAMAAITAAHWIRPALPVRINSLVIHLMLAYSTYLFMTLGIIRPLENVG